MKRRVYLRSECWRHLYFFPDYNQKGSQRSCVFWLSPGCPQQVTVCVNYNSGLSGWGFSFPSLCPPSARDPPLLPFTKVARIVPQQTACVHINMAPAVKQGPIPFPLQSQLCWVSPSWVACPCPIHNPDISEAPVANVTGLLFKET